MPEIVQKWQVVFEPDSKAGYHSGIFYIASVFMTFLRGLTIICAIDGLDVIKLVIR